MYRGKQSLTKGIFDSREVWAWTFAALYPKVSYADFVAIGLLNANGCFSSFGVRLCPEWPPRQQLFRAPIV